MPLWEIWFSMPPLRAYCFAKVQAADKAQALQILENDKDMPIHVYEIHRKEEAD